MILKFFKKHIKSYFHAINGISPLAHEINFWVELIIFIIVLITILFLKPSVVWAVLWIILVILLISAEAFNTSIELLCDFVSKKNHSHIAIIKDLAALSVLLVAIALFISYIIGIYVALI